MNFSDFMTDHIERRLRAIRFKKDLLPKYKILKTNRDNLDWNKLQARESELVLIQMKLEEFEKEKNDCT